MWTLNLVAIKKEVGDDVAAQGDLGKITSSMSGWYQWRGYELSVLVGGEKCVPNVLCGDVNRFWVGGRVCAGSGKMASHMSSVIS